MATPLENAMSDDRESGRRVAGFVLIVLGLVMLLGRLDLPDPWHLYDVWPVLIIVLGVARFWSQRSGRRRGAGLGMVVAGATLLLHTQGIVSLRDSWPLFIVGGGISILVSAWGAGAKPTDGGQS